MTLIEALKEIPDCRQASGRRHPLLAILLLACLGILCGGRSLYALAQFGRQLSGEVIAALGFTRPQTPAVATLHRVFKNLDVASFEKALQKWVAGHLSLGEPEATSALAIDGKGLRGIHGEEVPGVHLLAAFAHQSGLVVGQKRVDEKTNEITVILPLLEEICPRRQMITVDALLT